jgi:hypothetical protein
MRAFRFLGETGTPSTEPSAESVWCPRHAVDGTVGRIDMVSPEPLKVN